VDNAVKKVVDESLVNDWIQRVYRGFEKCGKNRSKNMAKIWQKIIDYDFLLSKLRPAINII